MLCPKQVVKQYILQGDLKTKKGVQITLVILLDNGELHLGRKYRKEKDVPKLLSIIRRSAADNNTGKEITPIIAVTKKAQIVKGILNKDIPFVLRFNTVTI